ncbi:MAG: sulfotransferase [Candidatus Sulfotelmatobacter sp.]
MSGWLSIDKAILPGVGKLTESIALLQTHGLSATDGPTEREAPIFLFSAGPRTGSTLLQRILVTDSRLLLWGEPLGELTLVSMIAEMVSRSINPVLLELWGRQPDTNSPGLATSWIATLYPSVDDFRFALRGLFDQWLGKPARERGFSRWGFKEIRLGATEASLLHWLYPNAKFVFIYRHPYDCYRSLADSRWNVYFRYPDMPMDSAASFANLWNRLAMSWSELPSGFPCFSIKYEDLIGKKVDFRKLESWLGIEIKEDIALSASVGGTAKRDCLTWYERLIIAREAEAGMRALGYSK